MINKDLLQILGGIQSVEHLKGAKFAYAMAKNKRVLVAEIEDLEKAMKMSEDFIAFENQRIVLCEKFSKKDADGQSVFNDNDNRYEIEDIKAFDVTLGKLKKKHKETLIDREKQAKEYNNLLDKPVNGVTFHKISFEDLPEEISTSQTDMILELIEG